MNNPLAEAAANLCPNPGFELLNPAGDNFPLNWSASHAGTGRSLVAIDKDAHSGSIAIRMSASEGESAVLNSDVIGVKTGAVTFHYKAIRSTSDGQNFTMYVIQVNNAGTEIAGRVALKIPNEHVGDGQWHQASVDFDFLSSPLAAGIILAPRINEASASGEGEWLVDDFAVVENSVGPRPQIAALHVSDPVLKPGKAVEVVVQIANTGDQPMPASRLRLHASGDSIAGASVEPMGPGESRRYSWPWTCARTGEVEVKVEWTGEGLKLERARHSVCAKDGIADRSIYSDPTGAWHFRPEPVPLQEGNRSPLTPFRTLKSSQLPDSCIGITAHLPRGRDLESIFEPEHLIDGDRSTSWSGRGHATASPGGADWIQIDLAKPQEISKVNLVPYHRSEGFPIDYTIKARQGGGWKTVAVHEHVAPSAEAGEGEKEPVVSVLAPAVKTDALRVEVTRFSPAAPFFTDFCSAFYLRLSEVEAITASGENAALASAGAGVRTSMTFRSYYNSREVIEKTYPELYNIGVKWNRVGQWGDLTCWAAVERKKGEYHIDPTTDKAITDSVANGVNILYTLCYGNPLYEETPWLADPGPVWRHGHPFTGDGGPTRPESIRGFVNYAKFVANHFKGRVHYYEIWNEENSWAWYGSPPDPRAFGTLVRETARALKEMDPAIKVMVGGTAALAPRFISDSLEEGAGPYIDAIAFHPYTMPYPEMGLGALDVVDGKQVSRDKKEFGYTTYTEMLEFYRKTFSKYNPNLEFWANEWNACPSREDSPYPGMSELSEAKQAARFYLVNTLLGVRAVWWSLANENTIYDWGVLRTGDLTRKPVYYTIQAMATLISGARRTDSVKTTVTGDAPELHCEAMTGRDGETLVAIWSGLNPDDGYAPKRVSLRIEGAAGARIDAVDTLHSVVQKVDAKREGDAVTIDGLLVPDYPVVVRIR